MGLLAPVALIALPLIAIIVALYLLKLRRPTAPVGSLHLWGSLTRDREANTLWQRLRMSVLMVLQILVLLLLIAALARPWVRSAEAVGQHAIIIIDVSASMAATDGDTSGTKTRLDAAKDRARSLVDSLPQGGTATLISSDAHASLIVPDTSDLARLRGAIDALQVRPAVTDMTEAVRLAGTMAARQNRTSVWILSDGDFAPVAQAVASMPAELHFVPFGSSSSNQAITAFSLQENAGNLQLFVQLANSSPLTVTRRLDLTVDDAPWNARSVALGPQTTQEIILPDVPPQARVLKGQLASVDDLAIDDQAWTINRASAPATVLLVTDGNKFLETALSLLPTVTLYKVAPAAYKPAQQVAGAQVDLTVFDAGLPFTTTRDLPVGNVLMFAQPGSNSLITVTGSISQPIPLASQATAPDAKSNESASTTRDPLLKYVDLSALHVARAESIELPAWAHIVLPGDKGPLIIAGEPPGRKAVVVTFDLHDSDLPIQTAFPLLIRNLVTYLLPEPAGGIPAQVSPSTPVGLAAIDGTVDRIVVEDPSAKDWDYPLSGGTRRVAFAETSQPGVYYVSQYSRNQLVSQEAFAVNLFSKDESMIAPNAAPGLPASALSAKTDPGTATQATTYQRELWPLIAIAGILLLLVEWAYAQRMAVRRAITEWQSRRSPARADRP